MSGSDVVARLRAADGALSDLSPSPALEGRLRARLRARQARGASLAALLGRFHRPLVLAAVTAGVALALPRFDDSKKASGAQMAGSEGPLELRDDRAHADAGPEDPFEDSPSRSRKAPRLPVAPPTLPRAPREPANILAPPLAPTSPRLPRPSPSESRGARVEPGEPIPVAPSRGAHGLASSALASSGPSPKLVPAPPDHGHLGLAPVPAAPSPPAGPEPPEPSSVECRDEASLEALAASRCDAEGLVVASFSATEPCDDGRYRSLDYQCDKPAPAPESPACTGGELGGGACLPLDEDGKDPIAGLREQASSLCAAAGLALASLSVDGVSCGGVGGRATYRCCPAEEPAPSGGGCFMTKLLGSACEDLATLEQEAERACEASGAQLADLIANPGCPAGQSMGAQLSCCQ